MQDWNEIKAWRKARREALIAQRDALPREQRAPWSERITALLGEAFPALAQAVVGFCWPYKGEFDARFAVRRWREAGAISALPEVAEKSGPLRFHKWWPGAPMARGVYGIPVPQGTGTVLPDAVIVPMNGFDGEGYRLGYGGGYFDRTLAALDPRPLAIGVAFEMARLPSIYPQPHDVPMDFVVTEAAIHAREGGVLVEIDAARCRERARELMIGRGLPRAARAGGCGSPSCYAHGLPGYRGET